MNQADLLLKVEEALNYIQTRTNERPEIGIILGTGLGDLAHQIEPFVVIPYDQIPNFPVSTVEFHSGQFIIGRLGSKTVVAMQGRFHLYEGYSLQEVTFPIRVMWKLGVKNLIISNACGSMNPNIPKKSIMIIDDHINLLGDNPLIGINDDSFGPRFVDMSEPYSHRLIGIVEEIAKKKNINIHKGVYCAMPGPSLETRAEYRMMKIIGADVVGMSTVPECIVARQMGIDVLGLSIITDDCDPDNLQIVNIDEIISNAISVEPDLTTIIKNLVEII